MRIILALLMVSLMSISAYAFESSAYTTPDSWSKHITANGVRASTNGLDIGNGTLKLGLTTRGYFNLYDGDSNNNIYQYFRARLSGTEVGNGYISANLNVRGAWNGTANPLTKNARENYVYYPFYDSLDLEEWQTSDLSLRLYQANIALEEIIPWTDIYLGRIYLDTLNDYKVDGGKVAVAPIEYLQVGAYYGLPVSYYSNLETQVVGGFINVPISASSTKVRAEYSYLMSTTDNDNYNTHVIKARVDQGMDFGVVFGNAYAEGAMINEAIVFDVGVNANVNPSRTSVNAYVMGQIGQNPVGEVNPYVASYESILGEESEFIMYGVQVGQGITDYAMLTLGFEGRYNFDMDYGSRDYLRGFGSVDLIGLVHYNNFIQLIGDYYFAPENNRNQQESKLLAGLRATQIINENIDVYLGTNVMNYQFHASPIKYYFGEPGITTSHLDAFNQQESENNAIAYLGAMWKVTEWCVLQLDYTYEYSSLFDSYNMDVNSHIVEAWVNFLF